MTRLSGVLDNDHMQRILKEFSRLGERCYLENAGASLYAQCLLQNVTEDLMNNVYMNPHTDRYTRDCIEQIRSMVLSHFNTDSSEYTVIFTSGTTQALKLVVESFHFNNSGCVDESLNCGSFVYLQDNHTSVLGLREIAADRNADVIHISHAEFLSIIKQTSPVPQDKHQNQGNTLLAYPAESNFNGYKYPFDCMENIKAGCLNSYIKKQLCKVNCNWYVLLDCASYVSTNKLDLSKSQPDFVCMSFYKMFGYPTGLGALIVKNSSANVLNQKSYFGGGTVDIVLSSEDFHVKRSNLYERFEDGTTPFLGILALKHSFDMLYNLIPKTINNDVMETIAHHTFCLAKDLYTQLVGLHHSNGNKVAVLYMDSTFTDLKNQGAIVTFNITRENGSYIGYAEFQHMADLFNIDVRTGCFCNSGSCQRHLQGTNKDMKDMYHAGHKCGDQIDLINGKPTGAVRASFAFYNTFEDVDKLVKMICRCFVKTKFVRPKRNANSEFKPNTKTDEHLLKNGIPYNELLWGSKTDRRKVECNPSNSNGVLEEIVVFPIKSCGAFKVNSSWNIGPKGLEYDREWMVVKSNGMCLTQKNNTRMCLIRPKLDLMRNLLIINFKGKEPISLSLDKTSTFNSNISICNSKVCTDNIKGYDCGDDVANWISEVLEESYLRLIRQADDDQRIYKNKAGTRDGQLSLTNQAQFLLINKATVRWLSDKIKDPLFLDSIDDLTDRFRGNLVIGTEVQLVEKNWTRVVIGKHEFRVEGPCSRCQMVCIDQRTGEKTIEPLRTISEQFAGKLRFGIYLSYVGPIDGSTGVELETSVPVHSVSEDSISR